MNEEFQDAVKDATRAFDQLRKVLTPKHVVLSHRVPTLASWILLVEVRDYATGELLLTDTSRAVACWLDVLAFRYVVGTNGHWMRDDV